MTIMTPDEIEDALFGGDDRLLTTRQVADVLQLKVETVNEYARERRIRAYRVGNLWRFLRSDIAIFLADNENGGGSVDPVGEETSAHGNGGDR